MFTLYTLIAEDKTLSLQSHFYHVQVGSTPAAQRALFALNAYCRSHKYYFAKRSEEDAHFRVRVAQSLGVKVYELPTMVAKVEHLVSHLRAHGALPFTPADSHNLMFVKARSEPSFYLLNQLKCLKRPRI